MFFIIYLFIMGGCLFGTLRYVKRRNIHTRLSSQNSVNKKGVEQKSLNLRESFQETPNFQDNRPQDKTVAELVEKNQQLEKQKADLLALIKKQMKLIDVLKRQKIHLESTRIIQFTEDELIHLFGMDKKDIPQ